MHERFRSRRSPRAGRWMRLGLGALTPLLLSATEAVAQACSRNLTADVVAIDQTIFYNRLGAFDPAGMIYALRRDVVPIQAGTALSAGNAQLRPEKRPRPLTLRMNVGDCLTIRFQNLLAPTRVDSEQPATRTASVHVMGMQPVNGIADDGSNVGRNPSSLVAPGGSATYTYYAGREGTFLLHSTAATTGGQGDGGQITRGLFGALNVEPKGAEWYRSQLTQEEMALATAKDATGLPMRTPGGQPVLDYDAVYPAGHEFAGLPIISMLRGTEIVHSDLNAVITGPNKGSWPAGTFPKVSVSPNREKPFREFTVIFHDEVGLVQAFPAFDDPQMEHTLHGVKDGFAINYGTGGIGAEIIANRLGVGPMAECNECKYEEFFLSSWAVGDPAMVVDVPANADLNGDGAVDPGFKATKALYPDDPSNVYHSYLNDRVKIRNLHAGPAEHHIFHLHAHQWLNTPDSDNSSYKDSQAIGPGGGYSYEIAHDGSGNRNKTPGDQIFHCHFYPHFAQGMWGFWRVHDVFESGTQLDALGRPVAGARALPDAEIAGGTPIPAVVPIPGLALAPMPGTGGNPGFPFFIPGVAGHRAPRPPLETVFDGGLPRHVVVGGEATFPALNPYDFHKDNVTLDVVEIPETGTQAERSAMRFHSIAQLPSYRVDPVTKEVTAANFATNGLPAAAGAPFADPCLDDYGQPSASVRTYKGAAFQTDVKYNKSGWHFPQHRMFALWADVQPTLDGTRAPEPMFMRVNSGDCVQYNFVNLVPKDYRMDDFQVLSPTDIIGQHIHLVKFDVTSSDGAANGWNYEDGSLSPGEVQERIHAINELGGIQTPEGTRETLAAQAHPYFGAGPNGEWVGAQETIQRWYANSTMNNGGVDRTLETVFSHDHYGPSTHQQTGLYAGLVSEPAGSTWRNPETGETLGGRFDGGPTSWKADILTANPDSSYREFNMMFQDFALAYDETHQGFGANPFAAINPPGKFEAGFDDLLLPPAMGACPNGLPAPCPEAVSAGDPGTMTVNYRNEPIAMRVRDPASNGQASGQAGDLSWAFSSQVNRADPDYNAQPGFYPALTGGVRPSDPYTPLLRAYEDDRVKIRIMAGAHEEGHNVTVQGLKWLYEPHDENSGYRASQFAGISEHFEMVMPPLPGNIASSADYLWQFGGSADDTWNGTWGLLRAYRSNQADLLPLPNNLDGKADFRNSNDFNGVCPRRAPVRAFDVTAVAASSALPGGTLVYNPREGNGGMLHDPTAILYVRTSDLDASGKLKPGVPVEPLILRANAGDCIDLTLRNQLPATAPDLDGWSTMPMIVTGFNANDVDPSAEVGLRPQLLAVDVDRSGGANVGQNRTQTVAPGGSFTYRWFAGELAMQPDGKLAGVPMEFGAVNLLSSDPIKHTNKGAVGVLIVEPAGAIWAEDTGSRASANVVKADGTQFREFVTVFQNDLNLRYADGTAVPNLAGEEDPEDSGQKAFNYRTEPLWKRMGYAPESALGGDDDEDEGGVATRDVDFTNALSNSQVGGEDPVTPVYQAAAGSKLRFRVVHPGGHQRNSTFVLHGHVWQELPYVDGSRSIGSNALSEWKGSQDNLGPGSHLEVIPEGGAGGPFKIPGDYLFRDFTSTQFDGGLWGILRVLPEGTQVGNVPTTSPGGGKR